MRNRTIALHQMACQILAHFDELKYKNFFTLIMIIQLE